MSLIPEPPEIHRSGAWRRGDLKAEPIFILGGLTYEHDCYGDNSSLVDLTTGNLQIIGGEQGVIASIDVWEYQPLPTLETDIGVTEALEDWNASSSERYASTLASSAESQASTVCQFPAAFIDGDKLHILIIRQRVLFQSHTFHWFVYHMDGSGSITSQGTNNNRGPVRSVADALHIEVDLIDKSVTYEKQDCYSASLTITSMNRYGLDDHAVDYDLECSTESIVGFLAERTGLDPAVFSVDHSPGATWTYSGNNMQNYGYFSAHWWPGWTNANSAEVSSFVIPAPEVFMPTGISPDDRKEYWADGFVNWPGWLGLNRDDGYVLAGDNSNRVVEISTFDSDVEQRYWGRSFLAGSSQLLEAEELFSVDALVPSAQGMIKGAPRDADNLPTNGAKQGVPLSWAENSPESVDPQFFWSNAETLKTYIYPAAKMVLYRIND